MFKDDDEEEENTFGVTRYPCMPSLVALQQMRNRLHLAFLGRKLMKWTALATGRELRRIAIELDGVIKGFGEEMRNAFILLARGRYFCPDMNKIVIENIGQGAGVVVIPTMKTVSAVKVVQFEIAETGVPPYMHLGLEKGGQAITEAKKAWLELLKKLIMMMQLRTSFIMVEIANKNATKRSNILNKIIIPRLNVTSVYILSELEELAREEFGRLKKVKEKKKKDKQKKHVDEKEHLCSVCDKRAGEKRVDDKRIDDKRADDKGPGENQMDDKIKTNLSVKKPSYFLESKLNKPKTEKQIEVRISPQQLNTEKMAESNEVPISSATHPIIELDANDILDFIKQRLMNIIAITRDFVEKGVKNFDADEFLNMCEAAKNKIEYFFKSEQYSNQSDDDLTEQIKNLKFHIREVADVTKEFKCKSFVLSSIDDFIKACEVIEIKLNELQPIDILEIQQNKIENLQAHIDDVVKMTQDYKAEGLLTPGVEEFLKSCTAIKVKIEGKPSNLEDIDAAKLDNLKRHISELEELIISIKENNIKSASIENFILTCKEFKIKIDQDKEKLKEKKALQEISEHIDETVSVGKAAQKEGLLSESIQDFIEAIGDVTRQINKEEHSKITQNLTEQNILDALKLHIDKIMESVNKLKSGNVTSLSVDKFLHSCETAKAKIELYQKYRPTVLEKRIINSTCSDNCYCDHDKDSFQGPEICQNMMNTVPSNESIAPCDFCRGILSTSSEVCETCKGVVHEPKSYVSCETCSRPIEQDILLPNQSSESPEHSVCKVSELLEGKETAEVDETQANDSSLGYFEKKIRKITKVIRTLNLDGTIREETETVIVKKEKRDPTETSLLDDDENDQYDVSYGSVFDEEDKKQILMCSTENQKRGFLYNKAKSDITFRVSPMAPPTLKQCVSYDLFKLRDKNSIGGDSFSIELDFCSLYGNSNINVA